MNLLSMLYTFGVITIGFLFGAAVKGFLDKDEVHDLEKQNRALRIENAKLKREAKLKIIEITDKRIPEVKFGKF